MISAASASYGAMILKLSSDHFGPPFGTVRSGDATVTIFSVNSPQSRQSTPSANRCYPAVELGFVRMPITHWAKPGRTLFHGDNGGSNPPGDANSEFARRYLPV